MKRHFATLFIFAFYAVSAGKSHAASLEHCDGMSNAERGHCIADASKGLELEMVTAYRMADARMLDYEAQGLPGSNGLSDSLQDSQVAFEDHRNTQCGFVADLHMGGSGAAIGAYLCLIHLTEERTDFLKQTAGIK